MIRTPIKRRAIGPFVIALAAASADTAIAQTEPPQLVIDAGGHTAGCRTLCFTPSGREVVTFSDDKTIRLWDTATGELRFVLRSPSASDHAGKVFAGAVSPDGRSLAFGGFPVAQTPAVHPVYIVSLEHREISQVLTGHQEVIIDLAFTPDGSRLCSAAGDGTLRVWRTRDWQFERELRGDSPTMMSVAVSPDSRRCVTASTDTHPLIWSLETGERVASLAGHTGALRCVAWSPDGQRIASGATDQTIRIWRADGQLERTFESSVQGAVTCVEFTPDSRCLVAAHLDRYGPRYFATGEGPPVVSVIDLVTGTQRLKFTGHSGAVSGLAVSPDGTRAASVGGDRFESCLWRLSDGQVLHKFVGGGRTPWGAALSHDGRRLAWGWNSSLTAENRLPLEHSFDLEQLDFGPDVSDDAGWRRSRLEFGATQLVPSGTSAVEVRRGGKTLSTLQPDGDYDRTYDVVLGCTMVRDGLAAVGSQFGLWLYDTRTGRRLRRCVGHNGGVSTVVASADGRMLLSASYDMTLRLWNLDVPGDAPLAPLLSLFIADREWIAWTPQGYYAASPGGERLMGWQVSNGVEKLASFFPAAQFRKQYFRPDVLRLLLRTMSLERAFEAVGEAAAAPASANTMLPPEVDILYPAGGELQTVATQLTVTVEARPVGGRPVTSVQLLLDGRPLGGAGGVVRVAGGSSATQQRFDLRLTPGATHIVQARADSAESYGLSSPLVVTVKSQGMNAPQPALYLLAVGISDYRQPELRLNFADDDARRIATAWQQAGAGPFRTVESKVLVDGEATGRGILSGLGWLKTQMTQYDVAVLFFSGHGDRDENGDFYLLPSDIDPALPLLVTGVPEAQVKALLQSIPGRVLVLLDACHAGAATGAGGRRDGGATDELVRTLSSDDYGVVVMASSMGREYSLENESLQGGNFTLAIMDGLAGKADANADGTVFLHELDLFVSDRVKELSQGRQHPVTVTPSAVRSFPLGRVPNSPSP